MSILELQPSDYTSHGLGPLLETPQPPKKLWYEGVLPTTDIALLAVVGSRSYTTYGKEVVEHLIRGLQGYPVGIVSGLALGIDGLAHEAALRHGLYTLAIPGSGLSPHVLYPASHRPLAERILSAGGGLLSEYAPDTKAQNWYFPERNRLIAGLCQATLLIEAGEKSGTLITARLTVDYNRELLAVPGNIFSKNTVGTHQFLKLGATLVTDATDILTALRIEAKSSDTKEPTTNLSETEKKVISLLHEPCTKDELLRALALPTAEANTLLMQMEMQGYITYTSPHYRALI